MIHDSSDARATAGAGSVRAGFKPAPIPNASYIGFTGTLLFMDDEITRRVFGDYVSTYDFQWPSKTRPRCRSTTTRVVTNSAWRSAI